MHRLAHFSIDRLRPMLGEYQSGAFAEHYEMVQAATEVADGFVWRSEDVPTPAPGSLASLTVWKSPRALESFVNGPIHRPFVLRRNEWFEPGTVPHEVVWWVSSLRRPTVQEAAERLRLLHTCGPNFHAFTLAAPQPPN